MDLYWEAVRMKVCRKCMDGDGKGNCRLPTGETCSLEVLFPEIVAAVTSVESDSFEPYIDVLRESICSRCEHLLPLNACDRRDTLECALDRYYPLVVEAIESVKESIESQKRVRIIS